jgi:3D (Asp-Asp-Asp) domain-containing protein
MRWCALPVLLVTLSACASHTQPVTAAPTPNPSIAAPVATSAATSARPIPFTATAYCTGRVTASGAAVSGGVVAADPAVLPIGTLIRISGAAGYDGSYRVLDTGARVRHRHVDLYMSD